MKILYAASEAVPFIKTGGLADVAGSLPLAIKDSKIDIRVVLPLYSKIKEKFNDKLKFVDEYYVDLGWRKQYAGVYEYILQDVVYYFIDNEYYFKRDNIYGEFDDGERFTFFSKASSLLPKILKFKPDIIHANDWHTGLIPLYVKDFAKGDDFYKAIKTIYTIHNLKYQGVFPPVILEDIAGLSIDYFHEEGLKFYDNINFMKAGIVYSDALTTVSKSYAEEIKYSFFGENLEGIIKKHEGKLYGIVNGIDYAKFNPSTDSNIYITYNKNNLDKKIENKTKLQELYGLPLKKDVPLIAMVTRLVDMKGLDLVIHVLDELLSEDIQFVMLGTGDKEYEDLFNHFEKKYPEKMASRIYFNEEESHKIYAGADMFLMPSMKEPCGISQLISLRYGTIPIVREVGGLKDTIVPYNQYTEDGNGFSFANFNAHELLFAVKRALDVYDDKAKWKNLISNAMDSKNDWQKSSDEYLSLYEKVMKE